MTELSRRLRVLVVAGRVPWPLSHGGRLRLYHFLRALGRRADVALAVPEAGGTEVELPQGVSLERIESSQTTPTIEDSSPVPADLRFARSFVGYDTRIAAWLRRRTCIGEFDVVLLSGAGRGIYAAEVAAPCVWDVVDDPVLYTIRDAWRTPWRWLAACRRAAGFATYVRAAVRRLDGLILSSPIDAGSVGRYADCTKIHVIPNGVDAEYFADSGVPGEPGTVAFVGSLSFPPNIDAMQWFVRRVWPDLKRSSSASRLLIVGKQPTRDVLALDRFAGVELAPDVADVRPYLARASVVVVPTRKGGGIKNKILESCAAARAVVASPVAVAGLTARDGHELVIARSAAQWRNQLRVLLADSDLARRIAAAGRRWVRREHDWDACGQRLYEVLCTAAGVIRCAERTQIKTRECESSVEDQEAAATCP
ncbi:MAG: glycosyltransferase [Planctomycetes bacterium]|nr:glycosyltransferase [Planctomycetota bacterium]